MNIILGYWLDSGAYPDALGGKESTVGEVVTGFTGLVGILETQLALTMPAVSEMLRISEWQEFIRKQDTGDKPYSKSFKMDSWNTAKDLLRRRDELVLAGWNPAVHVGGGLWIEALAELELANPDKAFGFCDRVGKLLAELESRQQINIEKITIVEDEELWDPWAIQLINLFRSKGVNVVKKSEIDDQSEMIFDLALLHNRLDGKLASAEASGDGSLVLVRSEQEWDAADFLVSWLQEKGSENTVLIKGQGSLFLDELLHRRGLAASGVDERSKWRAVLQVLPLTIDTYWKPLRINRMMELLTIHPSPVPGRIRHKLARVLSEVPGIGSPQWDEAIEKGIREYEEFWKSEGLSEAEMKKRRKSLEDDLHLWVTHDSYDAQTGIPIEKLVTICQKVGQWAIAKYQHTGDQMYNHVVQYTEEVTEGIKTLGTSMISRLQIGRILDSVMGEGAKLYAYTQEAAKWNVVNHPGQIWNKADTILWWDFYKDGAGPSIRTWTTKEKAWLAEHGVHLPDENIKRRREAVSWQRAARLANCRLIMFAPAKVRGKEVPIHPFWDEIRYAVAREDNVTLHASRLRKQQSFSVYGEVFKREKLSLRNLPDSISKWQVPKGRVSPREVESATSFERLVACPLSWTLRYIAKLRSGSALSLPNESRMLGNLGHKVLESLIKEKLDWQDDEVRIRTGELFDEWTPKMAAPLLELQNGVERNKLRIDLQNSLTQFFKVMNNAGMKITDTEKELQKMWGDDVQFRGTLDLVGETAYGEKLLIDAKWSKYPARYKEKLENLSVQLTLYHWLLSDNNSEQLMAAYFMLSGGEFYSLPNDELPERYHVSGPSLPESKERLQSFVNDIWSQLSEGTVIASGVEPDSDVYFQPLIDPPCKFCEYQNLCGVRGDSA